MAAPTIVGVARATPRIDLGVGDARDAQGLGQWQPADPATRRTPGGTTAGSTWNGEEPYWVDVTCYGIEIETYHRAGSGGRTVGGRHRHDRVGQHDRVG